MSDELETVKESAKAAQEVGKAGQEIARTTRVTIKEGSDLARWGAKVLGTVPEDLVGLALGDYLHELRIRNLDRIRRNTDEILERRGTKEPSPIDAKVAIRALEAASEESDETLQDVWARLFANAMDPNTDVSLQRIFIETLKQFEPIDALVFERIAQIGKTIGSLADELGHRRTFVIVSAQRLEHLGCIVHSNMHGAAGTERAVYSLTNLGHELWLAIQPDAAN